MFYRFGKHFLVTFEIKQIKFYLEKHPKNVLKTLLIDRNELNFTHLKLTQFHKLKYKEKLRNVRKHKNANTFIVNLISTRYLHARVAFS
jgi:hypothetical protein